MRFRDHPLCERCGTPMAIAQDPGDDGFPGPLEVWCPNERDCEHAGCMVRSCGEGADGPTCCTVCALWFCAAHIHIYGDDMVCAACLAGLPREPDMDNYSGPRGREAADELAHRQDIARRLK